MRERIKLLRKEFQLTQSEFGEKIGITGTTISDIERGKLDLTERNLTLICEKFHVNEEWLRYGTGDKYNYDDLPTDELSMALATIDKEHHEKIKSLLIKYSKLDSNSKKVVNDFLELILNEQKK
ncbi:helix-turn-helix protein [anaerobic digester metagenome]|uniref:helix-turn-helix domain-containing protein n=1 Tax=Anaerotignum sp. TaxID=2039241 RepID=UPI00289D28E6|nr:helix-turn-helix transcriptional regulator [Anaerotignum sp.]